VLCSIRRVRSKDDLLGILGGEVVSVHIAITKNENYAVGFHDEHDQIFSTSRKHRMW
jgi:hypothetical protein